MILKQISNITDTDKLLEIIKHARKLRRNLLGLQPKKQKQKKFNTKFWENENELIENLKLLHNLKEKNYINFKKIKFISWLKWCSLSSFYDNRVIKKNKYGIR